MRKLLSVGLSCVAMLLAAAAVAQDAPGISETNLDTPAVKEGKTGVVVITPGEGQVFTVDEDGKLYTRRGYKGVVPGVRDETDAAAQKANQPSTVEGTPTVVSWVGFQPFEAYSRVFVQVAGPMDFSVTRPTPTLIEISVPGATVSTPNDLRELVTRWFPTAIDRIEVAWKAPTGLVERGGVVVSIHLKNTVGYLYRQDGNYIFVDVEM